MRSFLERAVTSDAAGLAVLGGVALVRAVSYLPTNVNENRTPVHWLEGLMSPTGWAWVWLILGMLCITAIWQRRLLPAAVGAIVGLNLAWALSFFGIWAIGESVRGYVSALGYAATAALAAWGFGRGRNPEVVVTIDKE